MERPRNKYSSRFGRFRAAYELFSSLCGLLVYDYADDAMRSLITPFARKKTTRPRCSTHVPANGPPHRLLRGWRLQEDRQLISHGIRNLDRPVIPPPCPTQKMEAQMKARYAKSPYGFIKKDYRISPRGELSYSLIAVACDYCMGRFCVNQSAAPHAYLANASIAAAPQINRQSGNPLQKEHRVMRAPRNKTRVTIRRA